MKFENVLRNLWIGCGYVLVSVGLLSLICKFIVN